MKTNCVRKAKLEDCLELSTKMKQEDINEIKASDNVEPLEALRYPFFVKGSKTYTIMGTREEGVIGMFGSTPSEDEDYGCAWLLSSDELKKHAVQFMKECPNWVSDMGEGYKYLYNFIDVENTTSRLWLKFLGFKELETIPEYGHAKIPFKLIMKEL